jgi:hypothetical protein
MENTCQRYVRNEFYTVAAISYDVVADDRMATLLVSHTGTAAVTITLKTVWIAKGGNTITIKDTGQNASVNNITIETEGAQTIEGAANAVINVNGTSLTLQSDGSNLHII